MPISSLPERAHQPDQSKLPEAVRSLSWKIRSDRDGWHDGDVALVAVPVCKTDDRSVWWYELSVVSISADVDYFDVSLHGDAWGWDIDDVDFYVLL